MNEPTADQHHKLAFLYFNRADAGVWVPKLKETGFTFDFRDLFSYLIVVVSFSFVVLIKPI